MGRLRELGEETPHHGPILFHSGSACPPPSLMGTPSPSRPSTGSTATPSTDLMGLERGVWDQAGLGTTPWSPVLTPSMGAIIMQAEPPPFEFCFIVNSKLIFM